VRKAYQKVFDTITLHVTFTIEEMIQMSPTWAFVRTNSAGTNIANATGAMSAEGTQELFVFKKDDGAWKIARYSFSPKSPPQS
jgi:ketosteroid isomerase-like protein